MYSVCGFSTSVVSSRGVATGGNGGVRTPPLLFWRSFLILSKPGRNVWGGGKAAMDITLSFYTQDIRILGIRTPPPTSLGLATPLVSSSSNMIFLLIVIFVLFRLSSRRFVVTTSNRILQLTTSPCLQRNATMVILKLLY